ncbi:MAG TPA: phosphopentomutase [Candidatus Faecaligallichristensenella faecipullorum]|nr:phosphopentomutase [Candidatus Faecaligallichristensenella faecipullorum]
MKRVAIFVLDGVGIGEMPDAGRYSDAGADTLGHVIEKMDPDLPNLREMGLYNIRGWAQGEEEPIGCFGKMAEKAAGKDTTSGHWELAGLTLETPFPTYPDGFPEELIREFEDAVGMEVIGNKAASGTQIIEELGPEHLKTGKLIVYTSADSVFQIAAHESVIPPEELWHICRVARSLLTGKNAVGRVIARPFAGEPGHFVRTANRRDFSVNPVGETMLDVLKNAGFDVLGVGKIEDIFNHRGLTQSNHAAGNEACMDAAMEFLKKDYWKGLMFVNLVDTDMLYGHRNDVAGFAGALEAFDKRLPALLRLLGEDTLLIITADHGCDPAFPTTDHTREYVPLLVWGLGIDEGVNLGVRESFADVAATTLEALGVSNPLGGKSFYKALNPGD